MVNSVTCIFSFDFTDPIPNRFNQCLRIHLGDIISPRCFLTVSDISASLSPSNAISIQVTLGWFTFEPLKGPIALFDCIFANGRKPWFIETFWYCRSLRNSFLCNDLQDGSKQRHGIISICIDAGIDPSLPSPASIFEPFQEKGVHHSPARWESGQCHKGRDQLSRRSREKEMDCKGLNLWK